MMKPIHNHRLLPVNDVFANHQSECNASDESSLRRSQSKTKENEMERERKKIHKPWTEIWIAHNESQLNEIRWLDIGLVPKRLTANNIFSVIFCFFLSLAILSFFVSFRFCLRIRITNGINEHRVKRRLNAKNEQ